MIQQPDKPLTPLELFQRGIEITQEIRGRIEEARTYYLGRSSREPAQPLSEVFDPKRGPILKYFVQTVRIHHLAFIIMLVELHLPDILWRNLTEFEINEEEATSYVIVEDKTSWKPKLALKVKPSKFILPSSQKRVRRLSKYPYSESSNP